MNSKKIIGGGNVVPGCGKARRRLNCGGLTICPCAVRLICEAARPCGVADLHVVAAVLNLLKAWVASGSHGNDECSGEKEPRAAAVVGEGRGLAVSHWGQMQTIIRGAGAGVCGCRCECEQATCSA